MPTRLVYLCDPCEREGTAAEGRLITATLDGSGEKGVILCPDCETSILKPWAEVFDEFGVAEVSPPPSSRPRATAVPAAPTKYTRGYGPSVEVADSKDPLKCRWCEWRTGGRTGRGLVAHAAVKHPERVPKFPCKVCQFQSVSVAGLQQHVYEHHRGEFSYAEYRRRYGDPTPVGAQ